MSLVNLVPRTFLAAQLRRPTGLFGRFLLAPALNRGNVTENRSVFETLRLAPDDRVLEVGFGGGELIAMMLPALPRGHVSGADFSPEMVRFCAGRFASAVAAGTVELVEAPIEALPFAAASFSKACTVNTVYFWERPEGAAAELFRVLEPGGRLVVGFSPPAALVRIPITRSGFRFFEVADVERFLSQAGFTPVSTIDVTESRAEFLCTVAVRP
jgi:arsenite methyltransferase